LGSGKSTTGPVGVAVGVAVGVVGGVAVAV
jgi:hypothetical protein